MGGDAFFNIHILVINNVCTDNIMELKLHSTTSIDSTYCGDTESQAVDNNLCTQCNNVLCTTIKLNNSMLHNSMLHNSKLNNSMILKENIHQMIIKVFKLCWLALQLTMFCSCPFTQSCLAHKTLLVFMPRCSILKIK